MEPRPLLEGCLDPFNAALRSLPADQRAQMGSRVARVAGNKPTDGSTQFIQHFIGNRFLDVESLHRCTDLSRLAEAGIDDFGNGAINIGVGANDRARNAAQFHLRAPQACGRLDDPPDARAAGEGIEINTLVLKQEIGRASCRERVYSWWVGE